jgi:diacylglycerol kinase (ATP)
VSDGRSLTFTGRLRSIRDAAHGVAVVLRTQRNAWIHMAATLAVCLAGVLLRLSASEWCWIVLAIVSVWTAEALNTAFELLTDVASPGFDPLAGRAKDVAAGAVLISAIGSMAIGALIFVPRILAIWSK